MISNLYPCEIFLCAILLLRAEQRCPNQVTSSSRSLRILVTGGVETKIEKVPWLVQIRLRDTPICGAALINEEWILTAAHCFKGFFLKYYSSSFGRQDKNKHEQGVESRLFSKLITHPNYNQSKGNDADLALVKLNQKLLNYTPKIQPAIVQANASAMTKEAYCCIAGWGETLGKGDENALNQVCVAIFDIERCNSTQIYAGVLTNNMFCAGFNQGVTDSCQGDSGGPFMCIYNRKWILEGLTSGGQGCGNKPGVYTKVANYYDWIVTTMATN